jgi:hypothetical protein
MLTLHLNTDWTCDYFELDPDLYEFQDYHENILHLTEWQFSRRYPEGWGAWLERRFSLYPLGECVHYHLLLDRLPEDAVLYVNGRNFGAVSAPCTLDVTDYVVLEDNRLAFRVTSMAAGSFGAVRLTAVPCE